MPEREPGPGQYRDLHPSHVDNNHHHQSPPSPPSQQQLYREFHQKSSRRFTKKSKHELQTYCLGTWGTSKNYQTLWYRDFRRTLVSRI